MCVHSCVLCVSVRAGATAGARAWPLAGDAFAGGRVPGDLELEPWERGQHKEAVGVHTEQGRSSVRRDNELQGNEVSDEVTGFG